MCLRQSERTGKGRREQEQRERERQKVFRCTHTCTHEHSVCAHRQFFQLQTHTGCNWQLQAMLSDVSDSACCE